MSSGDLDFFRRLALFADLPEADLDRICQMAGSVSIRAGELLITQGVPAGSLYIVVDGKLEVTLSAGKREFVLAQPGPGDMLGEISLLSQSPPLASVRALLDSRLLAIGQSAFEQLLIASPSAMRAILRIVTTRLRENAVLLEQNERLAVLGILSAGLAHELNNPAAAVRRAASHLRGALDPWLGPEAGLRGLGLDDRQVGVVDALREEVLRRGGRPNLSSLEISDRERRLQGWLEDMGMDAAWELAPSLASAGWGAQDLDRLDQGLSGGQLSATVEWLARAALVGELLGEIDQGAERIAETVHTVRSYSYLDRGPTQEVDVNAGLENTLVILRHKISGGVRVRRDLAPDLPKIVAYGAELNQAWTNLIDNALDALDGRGELTVRTWRDGDHVVVEVGDNGPGILPEVQTRFFEPFVTTKPEGNGAGLGLHFTYNTVVLRHRGQISVSSQPGATLFEVRLPVRPQRDEPPSPLS